MWKTRGLRGSALEEKLNMTNDKYRSKGLALVQKIPTPIKPMEMNKEKGQITLAYFEQKSTVDYIGVVQGVPVCFDAKECTKDSFSIGNIHEHQIHFMDEFEKQQGISFLLIHFTKRNEFYYVPFKDVEAFWKRAKKGGRKSFRVTELDENYRIKVTNEVFIHYLEPLSKDLDSR